MKENTDNERDDVVVAASRSAYELKNRGVKSRCFQGVSNLKQLQGICSLGKCIVAK